MADEKIVFEVDVTSLTRSLGDAQTELEAYKRDMEAAVEENGRFSEAANLAAAQVQAQTKSVKQAEAALVKITQAQKALGGSLNNVIKNYDASGKSIDQNRKVLNALTAEYIKTANPSKEFTNRIKTISAELKKQEAAIGDTRRNVGNYSASITDALTQLRGFGGVVDPIQIVGIAFSTAGGGVRGFSAALATTGLPLLIAGINLLIDAFSTFKPIADGVKDIMSGLGASFATSYAEGVRLSKLKRELEDSDRDAIVTNALLKKSINELEAVAANKAAKDQDRITALKEANRLRELDLANQTQQAQKAKEIADLEVKQSQASNQKKLEILQGFGRGFRAATKKIAEASDESLLVQAQAQAKLISIQDDNAQQTINNANKIALLTRSIAEDKERQQNAEIKKSEELAQAEEKLFNQRQAALEKFRQDRQKAFDEGQRQKEKERLDAENETNRLLDALVVQEQITARRIGTVQAAIDAEIIVRNRLLQNEQLNAVERENIIRQSEDRINGIIQQSAQRNIQSRQAEMQATESISSNIIGLIGKVAEVSGASAEFSKALAFVQILVSEAIAIANAVQGGAQSGAATGPGAVVATPAFIATLVGSVVAVVGGAIGLLSRPVPKPKFAEGGAVDSVVVGGRPHAQGGTKYFGEDGNVVEFEKGERVFVLKKTASDKIDLLSRFNQYFGGRAWTDSPVGYAASGGAIVTDGGFVARNSSEQANNLLLITEFAKRIVGEMPQPVVSVVEINRVDKNRNRSISVSEL